MYSKISLLFYYTYILLINCVCECVCLQVQLYKCWGQRAPADVLFNNPCYLEEALSAHECYPHSTPLVKSYTYTQNINQL